MEVYPTVHTRYTWICTLYIIVEERECEANDMLEEEEKKSELGHPSVWYVGEVVVYFCHVYNRGDI